MTHIHTCAATYHKSRYGYGSDYGYGRGYGTGYGSGNGAGYVYGRGDGYGYVYRNGNINTTGMAR